MFQNKKITDMSAVELREKELLDFMDSLECKLKKIEAELDGLYMKAAVSHSLLVVRKISEEKLDQLREITD